MSQSNTGILNPQRIVSLDIFRGLNLALMIFVNELAEVKGLPWWTYHAPARADVMTYVDMVFPGFLIIVGMSLPLAIGARVRRGATAWQLAWYVLFRGIALLTFGIIIANGGHGSPQWVHGFGWALLALLGAILVWFNYPTSSSMHRAVYAGLRWFGLALLLGLAAVFRQTAPDPTRWLSYSYPEILGLIGYTYLVTGFCYLLTRRWRWSCAAWFLAFLLWNIVTSAKLVRMDLPWWIWPVQNGSMGTLVFAGVGLSTIFFFEPRFESFRKKAVAACLVGVSACVAAYLLRPLGISKIRATPTWVLFTIAASCGVYICLFWLCDVRKWTSWAAPVRAAGANTLLTYLLPDLWYYVTGAIGFGWFGQHFTAGWGGIIRTLLFTVLMLTLSTILTKQRFRLQI